MTPMVSWSIHSIPLSFSFYRTSAIYSDCHVCQTSSLLKTIPPPKSSFQWSHTLSTTSHLSGPLTLEFPFQQFFSTVGATNTLVLTTFRHPSSSFVALFTSLSWNPVAYHYNHFPASTLNPSSYPFLWPTTPAPEQTNMASQASLPHVFPLNDTIDH